MIKNKDSENFIRFIQWSIYTLLFFCLIIWIRITSANFDFGVISGLLTGVMLTMSLFFLAKYEKEKEKDNEKNI